VHEPEVLFLDEPQAGLDPQSRVMVREYIRSLRGKTTVVITTHDMDEAEKLVDRVCIIDRGKLLALDTVDGIKRRLVGGELFEITINADVGEALMPFLGRLQQLCTLTPRGDTLCLESSNATGPLAEVLREIETRGLRLVSLRTRGTTLEDVFIKLTGRGLRE